MNKCLELLSIVDGVATIRNKRQNFEFRISEEDLYLMDVCSWYRSTRGYVMGMYESGSRSGSYLHVVIYGKPRDGYVVDHKDRDKTNCTRKNLEEISHQANIRNSNRMDDRDIKYFGVSWNNKRKRYVATVTLGNKQLTLTQSEDPVICAIAYDRWLIENGRSRESNLELGLYKIENYNITSPIEMNFKSKHFSKES